MVEEAASLDRRLAPVEAGIDGAEALRGDLTALAARLDEQSWHVEQRLALLDERVGRTEELGAELAHLAVAVADQPAVLDHRLAAVVGDMTADMERRLAPLDVGLAALEQRLERIDRLTAQTASDHEGFSEQLSEQVALLHGRLAPAEEALARVDGLGGEIDRLAAMTASEHNSTAQRVGRQLDAVLERLLSLEANVTALGDVRRDFEAMATRTEAAQEATEIRLAQRLDGFGAALHRHVQELDRFSASTSAGHPAAAALDERVEELRLDVARVEGRLGRLDPLPVHLEDLRNELGGICERLRTLQPGGAGGNEPRGPHPGESPPPVA